MPKNNTTKSVLKALRNRKNAHKSTKKRRTDKRRPQSERESYADFMIQNRKQLSSTIFNQLPKRWFQQKGIEKPSDFNQSNDMLQIINAHEA